MPKSYKMTNKNCKKKNIKAVHLPIKYRHTLSSYRFQKISPRLEQTSLYAEISNRMLVEIEFPDAHAFSVKEME